MESGAPLLLGSKYNAAVEQAKYDKIVSATGCASVSNDTLNCLRNLPYTALNAALNGTGAGSFFPYADNDLISDSLYDQLMTGAFVKVPIIAGATCWPRHANEALGCTVRRLHFRRSSPADVPVMVQTRRGRVLLPI